MTAINLDAQIVASAYDRKDRVCSYTYEHTDGSRYTIKIPLEELQKLGITPANRDVRRKHLAQRILNHIQTQKPDDVRPAD